MSLYVGIDGAARRAARLFVGVNGLARKVRRAYIGVNNVARRFYASDPALFCGTGAQMSASHFNHGLARAGDFVLCAGGTSAAQNVDAFNEAGVQTYVEALPESVGYIAGVTASDGTAVFAGGIADNVRVARVYRYNKDLVRGELSPLQSPRGGAGAARVGKWALIGGGVDNAGKQDDVDAYDAETFARTTAHWMNALMDAPIGTGNRAYAFFGGGYIDSASQASASVTAYNVSLSCMSPSGLSAARYLCAGATAGDHALFAGGNTGSAASGVVDAYDDALVHSAVSLPSACGAPAGGALDGLGVVLHTENRSTCFFDAALVRKTGQSFASSVSVSRTRTGVACGARLWFARGTTTLYTYFS